MALDDGSPHAFQTGEFTENRDPRGLPPRPQTGKHAHKPALQRFPNPMQPNAHESNSNSQGQLPNLPKMVAKNNFIDSN